jgi:hypothetical protein
LPATRGWRSFQLGFGGGVLGLHIGDRLDHRRPAAIEWSEEKGEVAVDQSDESEHAQGNFWI